jgi:DNA-binding transcriptional LysR family regulator
MQVGELEAQLGLTLYHRLGRGVKLTAAGQLLLGYAQRFGALALEAEQAMAEVKGLRRGRLAIGASTTIGVYLLPNLLGEYRRRYPDIDLQFDIANTDDIERRLADGTLGAGLTESAAIPLAPTPVKKTRLLRQMVTRNAMPTEGQTFRRPYLIT